MALAAPARVYRLGARTVTVGMGKNRPCPVPGLPGARDNETEPFLRWPSSNWHKSGEQTEFGVIRMLSKAFSRPEFLNPSWEEQIETALAGDERQRLALARRLADEAYHHPECEKANARSEQRNFYLDHDRVTDRAVLLLHGWSACPFEMRELGERLHRTGLNVVGPRLAGHGTRVEDFACSTAEDWWAAARQGLAIAALSGRSVVIVGESMGGSLAVLLAQAFPNLIQQLILCAPCFEIANPLAGVTRLPPVRWLMPRFAMGPLPEWMHGYWYPVLPTSAVAQLVRIAVASRRTGPVMTRPIVIIQADEDQMVRPGGAHHYFHSLSRLPESEKRLIAFSGGHHNLTVALNPQKERVFEWILDAIREREVASR